MNLSAVVVVAVLGHAAAQLVLNTPATPTLGPVGPTLAPVGPTLAPVGTGGFDPNCKDKIDNCKLFGAESCKAPYDGWAKANCANTCRFCIGPTQAPPPCKDVLKNCDQYDKKSCTDPAFKQWAEDNCRYYCRLCPPAELSLMDSMTTQIPASMCKDKLDCRLYGKDVCTDAQYVHWAKESCPAYCGICTGVPTPPPACVDKIPDCARYQKSTCTNPAFTIWVQDNCMKYCGKCGGGSPPVQPPVLTATSGPTPKPHFAVPPMPGK